MERVEHKQQVVYRQHHTQLLQDHLDKVDILYLDLIPTALEQVEVTTEEDSVVAVVLDILETLI